MRNNSNNDPLCKLSGEDFVFCSRVVSHHKNEWVRNARDRTLVSPKKGKRSSPKSPPKPDLTVTQRPVGRPKGSKKSGRTEPEPKSEDAAEGDDGGKAVLASKVKVERSLKFKPLLIILMSLQMTLITSMMMLVMVMMMMMVKEYLLQQLECRYNYNKHHNHHHQDWGWQ